MPFTKHLWFNDLFKLILINTVSLYTSGTVAVDLTFLSESPEGEPALSWSSTAASMTVFL